MGYNPEWKTGNIRLLAKNIKQTIETKLEELNKDEPLNDDEE